MDMMAHNHTRKGHDLPNDRASEFGHGFRTKGVGECKRECNENSKCTGFDYRRKENRCYLKRG